MGVVLLVVLMAACGGPVRHAARTTVTTQPSTQIEVATSSTTMAQPAPPTLGLATVTRCRGCGQIAPQQITIAALSGPGFVVPEVDFTQVEWKSWGTGQATASADGYFMGPGENFGVTLYAFDLGQCEGTKVYQGLEWQVSGPFDPAKYFDVCTGQDVGSGQTS